MSMGAWCLTLFGALGGRRGRGADLLGRGARRARSAAPTPSSAATSAPTPASCSPPPPCPCGRAAACSSGRSSSATATRHRAPPATRLVLVASGMPDGHPTREALGRVESGAMAAELILSEVNEHHLGALARRRWRTAARAGSSTRPSGSPAPGWPCGWPAAAAAPWTHHVRQLLLPGRGLCFRFAWVRRGPLLRARRRGRGQDGARARDACRAGSGEHRDRRSPPLSPTPRLEATHVVQEPRRDRRRRRRLRRRRRPRCPGTRSLVAGFLAGAYIAFAGLLAMVASAGMDPKLWGGVQTLVTGGVFALGLILVIIAGSELLTGNMALLPARRPRPRASPRRGSAVNFGCRADRQPPRLAVRRLLPRHEDRRRHRRPCRWPALAGSRRQGRRRRPTGRSSCARSAATGSSASRCGWRWPPTTSAARSWRSSSRSWPSSRWASTTSWRTCSSCPPRSSPHVPGIGWGDALNNWLFAFLGNLVGAGVFVATSYWYLYARDPWRGRTRGAG